MEKIKTKSRAPRPATDVENLLERYYSQLLKWGTVLTRGDRGLAQDIVHDLCLYFALVEPDLSEVKNLDGYLYTCLRHLYLSVLARSSREAMQFVSVAEFDSIHFALSANSIDGLLEKQNDLRRICSYTVWRKESSKSASYLILLFFHGYARQEVAEIACLPIAAIYNKLKIARSEVKSHLEASGKLRIIAREAPPEPVLLVSPVSSAELFNDLQQTIFEAKHSECLPEEALLAQYRAANPRPIPCSLLSHIVSCKHCLSLIDRHFQRPTLEDREPPDNIWSSTDQKSMDSAASDNNGYEALMRAVRRQRNRVFEHRPSTLSIAVNGKITAFHDVQSQRSTLASRIEHPESADFVEVFTDQQIRLALLPIDERPPEGPHLHTQRVALSDDRWLELTLSFDGLGLHSEVTYFDPALATAGMVEEETDEELRAVELSQQPVSLPENGIELKTDSIFTRAARTLRAMMPRYALAWAMILAFILCSAGYLAYRYKQASLDAHVLLNQSVGIETADLKGETEHQILRLDATGADGHVLWQGTIDVWQENDSGRTMRRLYDAQHRLIAAEWRGADGRSGSNVETNHGDSSEEERELGASALWKQDVSARGFHALVAQQMQVRAAGKDYELTDTNIASGPLHLVSATLTLDRHLHVIGEMLRISDVSAIREVRFVQVDYERQPSASVPGTVFDPEDLGTHSSGDAGPSSLVNRIGNDFFGTNVQLIRTQIAVLYELNKLGADTGEPIEVTRTPEGRIRVTGTVANESRKREISAGLDTVTNRQLFDIRLASLRDLQMSIPTLHPTAPTATSVFNVAQAEAPAYTLLRKYFASKGWTDERVNMAVAQFSQDALGHSQRALQHAYALDRLGSAFTAEELEAAGQSSDRQWAEMAARHASDLEEELQELHRQLTQVEPASAQSLTAGSGSFQIIDTPANFARAAGELLRQTQILNRSIGRAFTSGSAGKEAQNADFLVADVLHSIPTQSTAEIARFATRLANSERAANSTGNRTEKR